MAAAVPVLMIAGAAMSAYGQYQQAQVQAQAASASAAIQQQVAQYNAQAALLQGQAASYQAQAATAAAGYNAELMEQNARISREQAAADVKQMRRDNIRQLGDTRAAWGASGLTMEGTPLTMLEDLAAEQEMDVQRRVYIGELEARGFFNNAALERRKGQHALVMGQFAQEGAQLSASAALLGGTAANIQAGAANAMASTAGYAAAGTFLTGLAGVR